MRLYLNKEIVVISTAIQTIDGGGNSSNVSTSNISEVTTPESQGSSSSSNMSGLDFSSMWTTVSGDYPELQNNRE